MISRVFVILFVLVNLRGALGYIFRLGDPNSSPGYSVRPSWFFLTWDVLVFLIVVIVFHKIKLIPLRYFLIFSAVAGFALLSLIRSESFYASGMARSILLNGFVFLCLVSSPKWIRLDQLTKAIEALAIFGLLFLVWQYLSYRLYGVLPSHSHEGFLIRYGSYYDDSLVAGILVPMFAGYYLEKFKFNTISEVGIVAASVLVVLLTGSLTAIASTLIYIFWFFHRRPIAIIFLAGCGLLLFFLSQDEFVRIWQFKLGSMAGHAASWDGLSEIQFLNFLGLIPMDKFVESGYLSALYNNGVFVMLVILFFHVYTLRACKVIRRGGADGPEIVWLAGAAEGLSISLLLVNINLPPLVYPPVYLVVSVFSGLVIGFSRSCKEV